jgi:hypothetical protein
MKIYLFFTPLLLLGCAQLVDKRKSEVQEIMPKTEEEASTMESQNTNSPPILIEINSVPPPFDVAGSFPYVLWINGMHIPSPDQKALSSIVNKIGEDKIPKVKPEDIHEGWIEPRFVKRYFDKKKERDGFPETTQ